MKKIIKHLIIILLVFIAAMNSMAIESNYKNNLLNVELAQTPDNHVSVLLVFAKPYNEKIKVVYKSDNEYNILLPETYHSVTSVSTLKALNVRSASVKLVPYFNQSTSNGYTKIILRTTRPVIFNAHASYITNTAIAQNNLLEKISKDTQPAKKAAPQQPKSSTTQTTQKPQTKTTVTAQKNTAQQPKSITATTLQKAQTKTATTAQKATTQQPRVITTPTLQKAPIKPTTTAPKTVAKQETKTVQQKQEQQPQKIVATKLAPVVNSTKPITKAQNTQAPKQFTATTLPQQKSKPASVKQQPTTQPKQIVTTTLHPSETVKTKAPATASNTLKKPTQTKTVSKAKPVQKTVAKKKTTTASSKPKAAARTTVKPKVQTNKPVSKPVTKATQPKPVQQPKPKTNVAPQPSAKPPIQQEPQKVEQQQQQQQPKEIQPQEPIKVQEQTVEQNKSDIEPTPVETSVSPIEKQPTTNTNDVLALQQPNDNNTLTILIAAITALLGLLISIFRRKTRKYKHQYTESTNNTDDNTVTDIPDTMKNKSWQEKFKMMKEKEAQAYTEQAIKEQQEISSNLASIYDTLDDEIPIESYEQNETQESYTAYEPNQEPISQQEEEPEITYSSPSKAYDEYQRLMDEENEFPYHTQQEPEYSQPQFEQDQYNEINQNTQYNIEEAQPVYMPIEENVIEEPVYEVINEQEEITEPTKEDIEPKQPYLTLDEQNETYSEPALNLGAQTSNIKMKTSSNPVSDPFNLTAPPINEGFEMSPEEELKLNQTRAELNDISDIEPLVDTVYQQAPDMENLEVEVEINEPYATKPIEPTLINQAKISKTKGFYLIRYESEVALVGYIKDKIFLLQSFTDTEQTFVQTRLTEKKKGYEVYLVRSENYKALVQVSKDEMKNIITL